MKNSGIPRRQDNGAVHVSDSTRIMATSFAIQCGSCGARLRVRKRSTVGKVVPCPKCKNPIKVTPPDDETEANALGNAGSDSAAASHAAGTTPRRRGTEDANAVPNTLATSFDDVDDLLADVEGASPEHLATMGTSPDSPPPLETRESIDSVSDSGTATLPSDEWVSASTKGRRQMLMVISIVIAAIVVSGILIIYLIYQLGRPSTVVSQQDSDKAEAAKPLVDDNSSEQETVPSEGSDKRPDESDTPPTAADEPQSQPAESELDSSIDAEPSNPMDVDASSTPTGEPGETKEPVDVEQTDPNVGEPTDDQPPGFNRDTPRARTGLLDDPILAGLENLDDFTGDTGAAEAQEALNAQRRNNQWVLADADAPFIEPPRPRSVDLQRQLESPLVGFHSERISMYRFLELCSTIIGAPIGLSPAAIRLEGIDRTTELEVNVVEMTFAEALEGQLKPLGLTFDVLPNSIRVRPLKNENVLVERTYNVEQLLPGFPQGFEDLQRLLESLIEPYSWQVDETEEGASIARQGETMVVRQRVRVQRRVEHFLQLLRHVRGLAKNASSTDLDSQLTPFSLANSCLEEPASYALHQPHRLGELVLILIETQNVDIVIDWEGLNAEGWSMDTELPLVVPDATFESVLHRLCGTLGVSFRVLGPRQFEILTRTRAAMETEVALFSLAPLLDQGVEIEAIANQIQSGFPAPNSRFPDRFYFDSPSQYLLARLSQDDQRALSRFLLAWQLTAQTLRR